MANLGEITEIVNASELTLEVGSDDYIMLTNLEVHDGRTENRQPTTGAGPCYTYGQSDSFFTATLLLTGPELDGTAYTNSTTAASFDVLNTLTANGDMNSIDWKIVAKDISGNTKTMTGAGILREYDIRKPDEGKVEIDIFVRLTGDPAVSIS